jgi:phosphatidylglycerophosphate synthase
MQDPEPREPRNVSAADAVTALRIPLAVVFVVVPDWRWRLACVLLAGISDGMDGYVARRYGASRFGVVLDPIADKIFMVAAFVTLAGSQVVERLTLLELFGVLLRDFAATAAYVGTWIMRRPLTLPARWSGKWATVGQFATLVALVFDSPATRPIAWLTIALGVWAVVDYFREGRRVQRSA